MPRTQWKPRPSPVRKRLDDYNLTSLARTRVELRTETITRDTAKFGDVQEAPDVLLTCWARHQTLQQQEVFLNGSQQVTATDRFRVRWATEIANLDGKCTVRTIDTNKVYKVTGVLNSESRNRYLDIYTERVTAGT